MSPRIHWRARRRPVPYPYASVIVEHCSVPATKRQANGRSIMNACALPDELRSWAGEIMDVDSHEMMPAQVWRREFGALVDPLVHEWLNNGQDVTHNPNHPNVPGYEHDDAPVDPASIWRVKGSRAPGAVDIARRDRVMDAMGVSRQLMFATGVGMW